MLKNACGGDVFVAESSGGSFASGVSRHDSFCYGNEQCMTGDFDGDGMDDLVTFNRNVGQVSIALSTGNGFDGTRRLWVDDFCYGDEIPVVGDFNGDGMDDIAAFTRGYGGGVYVALSNGSGFTFTRWSWD